MIPDDRQQFSELIDDTFAAFNRDPRPGSKEQYWIVLRKFSIATVRKAFMKWTADEERAPTPAAIRRLGFDVSREAKQVDDSENFVLIERVYAYTRPASARNKKGNPHAISLPETIARRRPGESAERYSKRIADEFSFVLYPRLRSQFQNDRSKQEGNRT